MFVVALLACGGKDLDEARPSPSPPESVSAEVPAPTVAVLAPTLREPPAFGAVVLDAARAVHGVPLRVAEGVGEQLVESCTAIEAAPNPPDPQSGDCTRGDSREDGDCGLNLDVKPLGNADARREWDRRFSTDPAAFDPRELSMGGTCGWLDVDLSRRTVEGDIVRYPATAEGGATGQVELTFHEGTLVGINLDSILVAIALDASVARDRDTAALVARFSERPTVEDYRRLDQEGHGEYASVLDRAARALEAELAAIPPPIAVGVVRWEGTADGAPRASVAVQNRSARVITDVILGLQLTKPDGQPETLCVHSRIAAKLELFGAMLRPDAVVRVFQSPWTRLAGGWDPATDTSEVVPLSVIFSDGSRWDSWATIRHAAPCP